MKNYRLPHPDFPQLLWNTLSIEDKLIVQNAIEGFEEGLSEEILRIKFSRKLEEYEYMKKRFEKIVKNYVMGTLIPKYELEALKKIEKKSFFEILFGKKAKDK